MADDQLGTVEVSIGDSGDDPTVKVETETRDEDAPFGRKDDGTPYKRDPAIYARRDSKRRRGASAPKTSGGSKSKPKPSGYRDSVLGLVQIVGLPLAAAGTKNDVFLADLITLNATALGIADAVDQIAQTNPKVAAALDKLAEVGPFGLLIGAMAPLIIQGACNHGLVPAGVMGAVAPDDLIAAAIAGEVPGAEGLVVDEAAA